MNDFLKWSPESGLKPWFETDPNHARRLVPISSEGRWTLWILMMAMASAIPAVLLLALFDPHYLVVLGVILLAEFGSPIWFLWRIRGRIKETR